MGSGGVDVQFSTLAQQLIPYQIETKSHASFAVYKHYEQAQAHGVHEPLLIIKANHKTPLVVLDAEHFFTLLRKLHENRI